MRKFGLILLALAFFLIAPPHQAAAETPSLCSAASSDDYVAKAGKGISVLGLESR